MTLTIVPKPRSDKVLVVALHSGAERGTMEGTSSANPLIDADSR